jgi:hypothetical protein
MAPPSVSEPLLDMVGRIARALEQQGFAYAVIGALARNAWARPRATTDADFALSVSADRIDTLRTLIHDAGLSVRKEVHDEAGGPVPELIFLCDERDPSLRLDLLIAHTPFEESVLGRRVRATLGAADVFVASVEDLLVYKLVAGRPRDLADVEEIGRTRVSVGASIDWAYVEEWTAAFGVADRAAALRARLGSPAD